MAKNITVYTKTNCPYCVLVKKYLDMKQITYNTVNMDEDTSAMEKIMSMTGRTIAPTTLVSDGSGNDEVIVGYNLSKIASSLA